jgi:hypothetical protein
MATGSKLLLQDVEAIGFRPTCHASLFPSENRDLHNQMI